MTRNSVSENLQVWDQNYRWERDGDEWQGQARLCGIPYEEWKQSLVEHLIDPYLEPGGAALEIGPGHGRWSEALAARAGRLVLVDLSPSCLAFCQQRFTGLSHLELRQGDGSSLPADCTSAIDLVWSFDSFVHISPKDIQSYLHHIERVLKPGGMAVIHHANRRHSTLWLAGMRRFGPRLTYLYRLVSIGNQERVDGWRSAVSKRLFRRMAHRAGLNVVNQFQRWGDGRCGVPRHNDSISVLRKPHAPEG